MSYPTTFFIKPAPGLKIADPETGEYLPETGKVMPRSAFWLRRVKDGDVLEADPQPAPAKPVAKAKE